MTYYTSIDYTNYTLVTDWYVAGNEIADHTYVLLYSFFGVSRRRGRLQFGITFRGRPNCCIHPRNPHHMFCPLTHHGFVIIS